MAQPRNNPIRIFVSSPGDLGPERRLVVEVCLEIQRDLGIPIEPLLWEGAGDKYPNVPPFPAYVTGEGAQEIINHLVFEHVAGCDIYLGMIWHRMGTPVEDRDGNKWRSGTEAEFRKAFTLHKETGRPKPFFFRKTRGPKSLDEVGPKQLCQVREFVAELRRLGIAHDFGSTKKLERMLRNHLKEEIQKVQGAANAPGAPGDRNVTFWLNRPASIGEGFVGRAAKIVELTEALAGHQVAVVWGGPGSGKSRLAIEYTYQEGSDGFWTPWQGSVPATLEALAPSLDVPTVNLNPEQIAGLVQVQLHRQDPATLWAIDNLEDLDRVGQITTAAGPIRLLITTRDGRTQLLPGNARTLTLGELDPSPAIDLLASRSEGKPLGRDMLTKIAETVGCLPMALEVLAVRLGRPAMTPERLLTELQQAPNRAQIEAFLRAAEGATIPRPEGVFQAIAGALGSLNPQHRKSLAPLGYVADAPLPLAIMEALTGLHGSELDDLLEDGRRQSLLMVQDGQIALHSLTGAAIAATNREGALATTLAKANARLAAINEDDPVALRAEMAHHERIYALATAAAGSGAPPLLEYANSLAIAYRAAGRTAEATALDEAVLAAMERTLGPDHPDTLSSRNNLAADYWAAGRTAEAIALDEAVLAARERTLGPDHPNTLSSRSNLADAYRTAGRDEDAARLEEERGGRTNEGPAEG